MDAFADWLFVALWVLGVLLTLLPFVPATLVILFGALVHELLVGFRELSLGAWLGLGALALLAMLLDNVAALVGARRYGAGRAALWVAILGGVLGLFFGGGAGPSGGDGGGLWGAFLVGVWGLFFGAVGVLVLPFLLAWLFEYLSGRRPEEALRAAWGTLVGLMGGVVAKVLVHLAMGVLVLRAIF